MKRELEINPARFSSAIVSEIDMPIHIISITRGLQLLRQTTKGGELDAYFSFGVPIAFRLDGELVCCHNYLGRYTARHLNLISTDANNRVPCIVFMQKFSAAMSALYASNK